MNPDELPLLELFKADKATGRIRFKHRRMLIFDADALGLLRKELIETLGLERARRVLTRFGYACGYRDALTSKELFHWKSDAYWVAAGPRVHALEGIVHVRLLRLQMVKPRRVFEVEAECSRLTKTNSGWRQPPEWCTRKNTPENSPTTGAHWK